MKPNLGGRLLQSYGERGTASRPGLALPLSSNRPSANGRHGMLTRPIAQTGLADTKGLSTWPESVRRDAKRGRAPLSVSIGRKLVTDWGLCNVLEMCSRTEGENVHVQNLPEPGKLWPGSVSNADQ